MTIHGAYVQSGKLPHGSCKRCAKKIANPMNVYRILLTFMLCAVCAVRGDQDVRVVHVGGDVPKPGPVNFEGKELTLDSAMAGVGMDLGSYYTKGLSDNDESRCPIRITIVRHGQKKTYNPSADATALRALSLQLNEIIIVKDFRKHPEKIEAKKKLIARMLDLGSTEAVDELVSLATLRHEYAEWRGQDAATSNGLIKHMKKDAGLLVQEGKGRKVLDILDLKLSALKNDGLGVDHPAIKSTMSLIQIYRDVVPE